LPGEAVVSLAGPLDSIEQLKRDCGITRDLARAVTRDVRLFPET